MTIISTRIDFTLLLRLTLLCGLCSTLSIARPIPTPSAQDADSLVAPRDSVQNMMDSTVMITMLQELEVTGQLTSKKTANGRIFRLSDKAKNSGDPYLALTEIPVLITNIASKTITTRNGETPLILIDGKLVNSGIDPIDPKFIDSVELIEVANAKYLHMGYSKVLNIRLKRDTPFYIYSELRTRHGVIPSDGFAGGNFEFGKKKWAINGSAFGSYIVHNTTSYSLSESLGSSYKERSGYNRKRNLKWNGDVMAKFTPDSMNYFAFSIQGLQSFERGYGYFAGHYEDGADFTTPNAESLSGSSRSLLDMGGTLSAVYYDHTFKDKSVFSAFAYYNLGIGDISSELDEIIGTDLSDYLSAEKSIRNQYRLVLNYDTGEKPYGSISGGYYLQQTHDKLFNKVRLSDNPISKNQLDNYIHMTFTSSFRNINYMISAGMQLMSVTVEKDKNTFWKPKGSASVTWSDARNNMLRASYILTNRMPESRALATFDTSTNPWLKNQGNPYLKPYSIHKIELRYSKTINKLDFEGIANYTVNTDLIQPWIYSDNGVAISSWRNLGRSEIPRLAAEISWNGWPVRGFAGYAYEWQNFNGGHYHGSMESYGMLTAFLGKFIIQAQVVWQNKTFTDVGYTAWRTPSTASLIAVWRLNKHIQIMAGMDHFWGIKTNREIIDQNAYHSSTYSRFKGESLKPFILFSWTLRRNSELSIQNRMPLLN